MNSIQEQLENSAKEILNPQGFELVELRIKGNNSCPVFQFFIDCDNSITIKDCTSLNNQLTDLLDIKYPDFDRYRIEVSSPGLDRPLKTEKDFIKKIGRDISVTYTCGNEIKTIEGTLLSIDRKSICLNSNDKKVDISILSIKNAKIKLKW
jgi:ribosome maturation factor RimP